MMVMAGKGTDVLPQPRSDQVRLRSRPSVALPAVMAAEGVAFAALGIDGILQRGMEWVQYTTAGLLSGAPRPMSIPDAIRAAAPRPVLIIAGTVNPDEPVAARWFQAASPATVQVWVVPRAGHTQGLATAPRAWETHVISFLDAALHPNATAAGNEPGTTAGAAAANGARLPGTDDLCRELR